MILSKIANKGISLGPLLLLYYLSISEIDTYFENFLKFFLLTFS